MYFSLFFFFLIFLSHFIVCCDSRWKFQKYGITDSTCPSDFLAWEHQQQYLLDIGYIVTDHQNNKSSPDFV